jgi:hypothetical protein
MQANVQNAGCPEQMSVERTSQQSTVSQERVQQASSSSRIVSDSPDLSGTLANASAAPANMDSDDRCNMQITSDWIEMDQCIYPARALSQTNYRVRMPPPPYPLLIPCSLFHIVYLLSPLIIFLPAQPLDSWLASCEQDCFLSSWAHSLPADDGPASGEGPELLWQDLDDPIAQMLKVREKALLAALRCNPRLFGCYHRAAHLTFRSQCAWTLIDSLLRILPCGCARFLQSLNLGG